jgi:HSP20 family protein
MALQSWLPHRLRGPLAPFAEMQDLQREMNRLVNWFAGRTDRGTTAPEVAWTPAADIYEVQDELVAVLELPGVTHKDIEISVVGDTLTVRGERRRGEQVSEENYYRVERSYGPFFRSLVLPSMVDAGRITASYRNGLLEIRLPKREEAKPKPIPIEGA